MSLKIRLSRLGTKKKPFYRIVVANSTSPRNGSFLEIVGYYNPRNNPQIINLKFERINSWILKGAKPSLIVSNLIKVKKKENATSFLTK